MCGRKPWYCHACDLGVKANRKTCPQCGRSKYNALVRGRKVSHGGAMSACSEQFVLSVTIPFSPMGRKKVK